MSVVIVGQSSFMARAVREIAPADWIFLSHTDALADDGWCRNASCVASFAFDPRVRAEGIAPGADIDSRLADMIAPHRGRYVMLSSQMVYGAPQGREALRESDAPQPATPYGQAKLAIERALQDRLGADRVTILRPSVVFGFEPGRRSFFGQAQTRLLQEQRIVYDISPLVKRDFLAVRRFAGDFARIAGAPAAGIYNLGAGFGVETGKIAQWLIEGYGAGELVADDSAPGEQFWLDMSKTRETFGLSAFTADDLRQDCLRCGAMLKSHREAA